MLLGRNYFGGYLVVTARYLVVTAGYLVVTARYRSLLLVPIFSMNTNEEVAMDTEEEERDETPEPVILPRDMYFHIQRGFLQNSCSLKNLKIHRKLSSAESIFSVVRAASCKKILKILLPHFPNFKPKSW